mgnify:CR=1 FL=1
MMSRQLTSMRWKRSVHSVSQLLMRQDNLGESEQYKYSILQFYSCSGELVFVKNAIVLRVSQGILRFVSWSQRSKSPLSKESEERRLAKSQNRESWSVTTELTPHCDLTTEEQRYEPLYGSNSCRWRSTWCKITDKDLRSETWNPWTLVKPDRIKSVL